MASVFGQDGRPYDRTAEAEERHPRWRSFFFELGRTPGRRGQQSSNYRLPAEELGYLSSVPGIGHATFVAAEAQEPGDDPHALLRGVAIALLLALPQWALVWWLLR
jgi:hypothetical protein